jgi:hypothetical protein
VTIFHVLKYPISNPPTAEELEALPPKIFYEWIKTIYYSNTYQTTPSKTAKLLHSMYGTMFIDRECVVTRDIKALRKMILEYDDHIQ